MDWMQIISAHVMWKQRLLAYIEGRSEEDLDPETIARDDRCVLGKWIYSEGQRFNSLTEFEEVRQRHAHFHLQAAEVVRLVQTGRQDEASRLLHGQYSKVSEQLKRRILLLSRAVQPE